eukprot:tig00000553_g2119.t1
MFIAAAPAILARTFFAGIPLRPASSSCKPRPRKPQQHQRATRIRFVASVRMSSNAAAPPGGEKVHKSFLDDIQSSTGEFVRKPSTFRNRVAADGSTEFAPEAGRYRLYVSHACPWAHRTILVRKLKGLEKVIDVSVVHYFLHPEDGWTFDASDPDVVADPRGSRRIKDLYYTADPNYVGKFTVPVLWDDKKRTIVNNESSEIIRMLNSEFNAFAENPSLDLYPEALRPEIDRWNDFIYPNVNNGVYRCGFATSQEAYEKAFHDLFFALNLLDGHLASSRYLCGAAFTEADVRLFTTLVRFDPVYVGHFKCNKKRVAEYAHLSAYLRDLYQMPGVKETTNMRHIKWHYYYSHDKINPSRVVPVGPDISYLEGPNTRAAM